MEHLFQKSKCSIFHNIFKYMIFQRLQKALIWSKGLIAHIENLFFVVFEHERWACTSELAC